MRCLKILITGLLCLHFYAARAQSRELEKKISLQVEAATLAQLLEQIQEKYQLRFSYVNNELPADTIRHFEVEEMPLFQLLDSLLDNAGTGYLQHGDQIIINKTFRKKAPAEQKKVKKAEESHLAPPKAVEVPGSAASPQEEASPTKHFLRQELSEEQLIQQSQEEVGMMPERKEALHHTPLTTGLEQAPRPTPAATFVAPTEKQDPRKKQRPANPAKKESRRKNNQQERKEKEERRSDAPVKPLHLGLFYPISNHGTRAPLYVNRFSAHALVGVAAGLEGWELAGLGNIEKDYVEGVQFAGLFNVVKNEVEGVQFAGLFNANGGSLKGGHFSGFLNYSGENVQGIQAAGFMNVAGSTDGAQLAGFMNIADSLDGLQVGGFINIARSVEGLQLAGFINLTKNLKGTQIGVFNFVDSLERGVPIGVFSFVRGGYKALEVFAAEDFHTNIAFKTGVQQFYNILALGLEVNDQQRLGIGYGLGAEWRLGQSYLLNTDILSYYVLEHGFEDFGGSGFDWHENTLYKVRLLASRRLGREISLFAGPTFNIFSSKYQDPEQQTIGSKLVENVFYERTTNNTNVKMWFGFNAGIRF